MQQTRMMQWGIASSILLFANLLLAQDMTNLSQNAQNLKAGSSLPAPTTISDQAFKAKAKQQSDDVNKQIRQEASSQIAQIISTNKPTAAQQQDDNTNTNLSPNIDAIPTSDNQKSQNTDVAPTASVIAPPINQSMPINSNNSPNASSGNSAKSNWQIQY